MQLTNGEVRVWRFVPGDLRLAHGDGREIREGETLSLNGEPVLCKRGFHGSETLRDAIRYVQHVSDPILTSARISGRIDRGEDKLCGTEVTTDHLPTREQSDKFLRRWALWCAGRALRYAGEHHDLVRDTLRVVARYLRGEATDVELAAARAAARAAAWAAASDAACDAACDAAWSAASYAASYASSYAAWSAASYASSYAAWSAASYASRDAASYASRSAYSYAACDAAWSAARADQERYARHLWARMMDMENV